MASTGAKFPTASSETSEAPWEDNVWLTEGNIFADDGATANVVAASFDTGDQTSVLKAYTFDFSGIPAGATIVGVTCRINTWYANGTVSMDLMQLLDTARAKVGTNQCAVPVVLSNDDTTIVTKGGAADTWGNALTRAWVQDADFGVALGFIATDDNADVFVDYVTLEIEYTVAAAVTMATAVATSAAPSLTVTPGAVSVSMGAAALTSAAPTLIASVAGGAVSVNMGAAVATATAPSLTVTPGAVTVDMDPAIATSEAPALTVAPGAVTVDMGAAVATSAAPSLTVTPGTVAILMAAAVATSEAPNLTVTPGAIAVLMAAAIMTSAAPSLTVGGAAVDDPHWVRVPVVIGSDIEFK